MTAGSIMVAVRRDASEVAPGKHRYFGIKWHNTHAAVDHYVFVAAPIVSDIATPTGIGEIFQYQAETVIDTDNRIPGLRDWQLQG